MPHDEADISEIFSSIQGEGPHVGRRHIFVRLAGCNLACRYCDTAASLDTPMSCSIEPSAGHEPIAVANPISATRVARAVADLDRPAGLHHAVSVTGGEPLLCTEFLAQALPLIRAAGPLIYLETNGTLPDELEQVIDLVDIVAMDIKLPSATGQTGRFDANGRFLQIAASKEVFVKVIFDDAVTDNEIESVCSIVESAGRTVPVVLQPVTPRNGVGGPLPATILRLHGQFAARLPDVRVIPQIHPLLGLR